MNELIHKGNFDPDRIWGIIFGTLIIVIITALLLGEAFSGEHYSLAHLVMAIGFFIFFGYFLIRSIHNYKAITIYENSLKIRWLFGLITTTIHKKNITQFGRSTIEKSDHIYIKTIKYDLLLEEKITENNELIIEQLRSWRIKRKDNIHRNEISRLARIATGIGMMIFSVLLLAGIVFSVNSSPSITDETTFATVSGYLQRTPEIIKPRGKSSTRDVTFYLLNYPGIKFSANAIGYHLMNHDSLQKFRYGDSITFLITRNDYEKRIARNKKMDYFEKHSHWSKINVYAVEIENKKQFTLQQYKETLENNKGIHPGMFLILIASSVGLFVYGIKEFRIK
jgi:hypothetical protein